MGFGPAIRENDKYRFENSVTQAFGPWHPNTSRSALVCVTASGFLKLFFSQNNNQVQDIQLEMESVASSDDLITHAAICSERGDYHRREMAVRTELTWYQANSWLRSPPLQNTSN